MTKKNPKGIKSHDKANKVAFFLIPPDPGPAVALNATTGVRFSQSDLILDDWWLFGGTKWTRTLFRLRHPIVYSKRGLRGLYRRIRRLFVKEPPPVMCRSGRNNVRLTPQSKGKYEN